MKESPEARELYTRLLKNLGYEDDTEMKFPTKYYRSTMYKVEGGSVNLQYYLKNHYNKKSYIYPIFLETFNCNFRHPDARHPEAKSTMKMLEIVNFEEKANIAEVGWEVTYSKHPMYFTMKDRIGLILKLVRQTKKFVESAKDPANHYGDFRPVEGNMLMEKPIGPKVDLGFSEQSMNLGRFQRGEIAKRYGFGDVKEDGCQYGRFDKELILKPV